MTRTSDSVPLVGISRRTFCKGAAVLGIWGGLASFGLAGCAPHTRAEELADAGATVEWVPGFNLPFLMFNCEKPPFDDVRVRQALLYAIDVDSLIGTYMAGHARAATSLLPDYFRHYA